MCNYFKTAIATMLYSVFLISTACGEKLPNSTNLTLKEKNDFFVESPSTSETSSMPTQRNPINDDNFWDTEDVSLQNYLPEKKHIAFTFDDAPKRSLEQILAVFAAYNVENPNCKAAATIFCNGIYIDNDTASTLQAAWTLGFELGNHTQSHVDLTTLSATSLQAEIDATDQLLYKIDGKKRHLLRTPFGKTNETILSTAETPIINWTIDTLDWTGLSEDKIYENVFSNKSDGAIVLMHDGYPNTVRALKRLLPDLKADGYQVVGVSQMAKAHNCKLKNGSVYIRARKK